MSSLRFERALARIAQSCAIAIIATLSLISTAQSETIRIVALGASNTAGYGTGGQGWPGQLASMLRAKGYDVSMSVQAVVGDTSAGILSRAGSIPAGTRVVVFDVGRGNDVDSGAGASSAANRGRIAARIQAQGAKAISVPYAQIVGTEKTNPSAWQTNDVHHHLTVQSHRRVAAWVLPKVIAAIGKPK